MPEEEVNKQPEVECNECGWSGETDELDTNDENKNITQEIIKRKTK